MAITAKLFLKPALTASIIFNAQKLTTRQNLALVNTTNPLKQLGFAFDDSDEKTNIIVTTFNIKKH